MTWRRLRAGVYVSLNGHTVIRREEWSNVGIRGGTAVAWTVSRRSGPHGRFVEDVSYPTLREAKDARAPVTPGEEVSALTGAEKVHQSGRDGSCPFCPKVYQHRSVLVNHVQAKHYPEGSGWVAAVTDEMSRDTRPQ